MNFVDKFCGRSRSLTLNHYDKDELQNIALIKDNKHEFQMPQLIIHMFVSNSWPLFSFKF